MNIQNCQAAFGKADITSRAMQAAMERWKKLYYQQNATDQTDPCQRIAYTLVSKLRRAVFAEYSATAADPVVAQWLRQLDGCRDMAMEMAMSGGECYIKPYPDGMGFSYTLIPRSNLLIFERDRSGMPTDVGSMEQIRRDNQYYTLLERRSLDESGFLNIIFKIASTRKSPTPTPMVSISAVLFMISFTCPASTERSGSATVIRIPIAKHTERRIMILRSLVKP